MKIKWLILLLVLLLSSAITAHASSKPSITIGNLSASPLQRILIPVSLATQGASLVTVMMDMKYDASVLSNPNVTIGAAGEGKTLLTNTLSSGALRISLYDMQNTPLHDGTIVNIAFTLTSAAVKGSDINVTFDEKTIGASDASGNDIGMSVSDGVVAVH